MVDITIDEEITSLQVQISTLTAKLYTLQRRRSDDLSKQFISVNGITKEQVELRDGEGRPWFGHITKFVDWMKETKVTKRWAEWNGIIYHTSDLFAGRMVETPGRTEHLS